MKIAVIGNTTHSLHNPLYRGVERFTHSLTRKLAQIGHEVVLFDKPGETICPSFPILSDEENRHYIKLKTSNTSDLTKRNEIRKSGYIRAMKHIASGRFDIVHNNSLDPLPLLASQKLNALMITTLHSGPSEQHVYLFEKMRDKVNSYFCATSSHTKKQWRKGVKNLDVALIPNGVLALNDEISFNFKTPENRAFWVGPIQPQKKLHEAIRACHLAGVNLDFAGEIIDEEYFEDHVLALMSKDDRYLGNLDRTGLKLAMERARVGLSTCVNDEQCNLALIEMLSAGLPISGYAKSSIKEIINTENGYLAKAGDTEDLAIGIQKVKDLCKVRIQQQTIRRFNLDTMVLKYERVYKFLKALHEKDRKEQAYWHLYSSRQGTLA